ncbi:MAG: hypothetical protein HY961_15610 [Ignavibacteriae bacterium]|nr:hypothetical protein [Ignavibacteriota bacterium]
MNMNSCVRVIVVAIVAFSILQSNGGAQTKKKQSEKVAVRAVASQDAIHPGSSFFVALVLTIDKGWHINSAKPADDNLIATSVETTLPQGLVVENIRYPQGETRTFAFSETPLDVYEDSVYVLLQITAGEKLKPGKLSLSFTVDYQACNDNICLAPTFVSTKLDIRVVSREKKVNPIHKDIFRDVE